MCECVSLTAPDPDPARETKTVIYFRSCTMCRGFIQGLQHNALHLLRFCSDVQQIPPQTWLSCCIKAEHQWGCTSPFFLEITSRFCWVLHLLPVVRRDGLNLSLNGKERWVWLVHFILPAMLGDIDLNLPVIASPHLAADAVWLF